MKKRIWRKVLAGVLVAACLLSMSTPALAAEQRDASARAIGDDLAGYWTFEGDTNEARLTNHADGSTITASLAGGAATRADGGIDGGSAYFDGTANSPLKLNLKDANQGLDASAADFTLAVWVNYDADMSSADNSDLFQQTDSGRTILYVNNADGKYGTYMTATNVAMSTIAPVGGRWHHVVVTWEYATSTMTCYVNGTQEVREVLTGTPGAGATDIWIGSHKSGAGQEIKGYVDELRYYTRALTADDVTQLYQYNGYNEIAERASELTITVNPDNVLREITPAMFGINHRYHKNGYGTWDTATQTVNADFNAMVKEGGFGSIRWPGGTVSNLFTWKDSIGPLEDRIPTIAGNNFYSDAGEAPVEPGFGLDEAAEWICDDLGAEMIYVYGMGRGSAQDAADLVEYLNAPNDGSNPGGGTDWAAVRAANGHPEPYGVTKFEIGNEFTDIGQNYWATPRGTSADQAVEDYIMGGRRDFAGETQYYQHNDRVVKEGDWRKSASYSDGNPGEERYLCYVPVIEDTATIYVNGVEWEIVDTLDGQTAEAEVCTLDYETGKITFGDGVNGKIPPAGQQITAHYSSNRDGFAAYSDAMKAIAAEIGIEIKIYSGVHDALQSSFITKMHEKGYDDKYDGVIYHPYAGSFTEATYDNALTRARAFAATIGTLKDQMDSTTGTNNKEVAVSEFGINANGDFTKSLGNAMYAANFMIDCVNRGAAYLNRHCLVDFTVGDNLGAWEQAVIQCLGSASSEVSGNQYVSTPSAQVFSIFNYMTGGIQVDYTATGNDNYTTSNSQTIQKLNIYTTKDDMGNVYVLLVNNQKSADQEVHIALADEDLTGREIEVWSLTSNSVMDQNTQAEPDKVTVQTDTLTAGAETLTCTLPAHSISSFKIAPVDTTALEDAITAANAAKSAQGLVIKDTGTTADQVDKDVRFVTQDAVDTLSAAITTAQAALDAADKTSESVAAAASALNTAVDTFTAAIQTGTKEGDELPTISIPTITPPSTTTTTVTKNEDGSTTTTVTDNKTGIVTATTEKPDGATETVETRPDGTVTATTVDPEGGKVEKVTAADESVTITVTDPDGSAVVSMELPGTMPTLPEDQKFVDVPDSNYAADAINSMTALGVINGVGDQRFDRTSGMKRGDLASMLYRMSNGGTGYDLLFEDVPDSKYYADGIAWAAETGVVTGYSESVFAPEEIITREQLAVMLYRYAKLLKLDTAASADALNDFTDGSSTHGWAMEGTAWCVENGILQGRGNGTLDPRSTVIRADVALMLQRFIALIK